MAIRQLQPQRLWQYFHALCQIPRPSHHETQVQDYVLAEAKRLNLFAKRDEVGNIIVRKPASKGHENAVGVILQAHLDMVAQKNQATPHDFLKDPIQTVIDGDWVRAQGTTLGADNGIGAAAMLAVLADNDLKHGPLEALFTATEETGMDGAKGLQPNELEGKILLNLDSEEEDSLCIGCAGGIDAEISLAVEYEAVSQDSQAYHLALRGLKGGHSGVDIHKQRGNANRLIARALSTLSTQFDLQIAQLSGGSLRNAIAREADALFYSKTEFSILTEALASISQQLKSQLNQEEETFSLTLSVAEDAPLQGLSAAAQQRVLSLLRLLPDGVDRMSPKIAQLVETSSNLAVMCLDDTQFFAASLLRSLQEYPKQELADRMRQLVELLGGTIRLHGNYSGWTPNPDAPINQVIYQAIEEVLGRAPEVSVIHAGLECGLFANHYPDWQMISFGPTIEMPHSPDERVHIQSVARFYTVLEKALQALTQFSA